MKKVLYMIQCEGTHEPYEELKQNANADIIYLSWKQQHNDMIFFPDSSWTDGRNRLMEEARGRSKTYEYYILLDDDIQFNTGGFALFEELLLVHRPAIAVPHFVGYDNNVDLTQKIGLPYMFDACFTAFHKTIFFDDTILPYCNFFDEISWWYSQYILIVLSNVFYEGHILQFNEILIFSSQARDYPRDNYLTQWDLFVLRIKKFLKVEMTFWDMIFIGMDRWIYSRLLNKTPQIVRIKKLKRKRINETRKPPLDSYSISDEIKDTVFRARY